MSTLADKALTVALFGDKRKVRKFERKHIKRLERKLRNAELEIWNIRQRMSQAAKIEAGIHAAEIATLRAQAAAPIEVTEEMLAAYRNARDGFDDLQGCITAALAARPGAAP